MDFRSLASPCKTSALAWNCRKASYLVTDSDNVRRHVLGTKSPSSTGRSVGCIPPQFDMLVSMANIARHSSIAGPQSRVDSASPVRKLLYLEPKLNPDTWITPMGVSTLIRDHPVPPELNCDPCRALSCELPTRTDAALLALRGLHRVKPHAGTVQTLEATLASSASLHRRSFLNTGNPTRPDLSGMCASSSFMPHAPTFSAILFCLSGPYS